MSQRTPQLVARAEALVPLLSEHAADHELSRRLHPDVLDALGATELCRVTQPARFGGAQANFGTLLAVLERLGRGCGSTAWVVALANSWHALLGTFPERAQREFWAETPHSTFCGVLRPAPGDTVTEVDGGLRVSAQWPVVSGCLHAEWAANGVRLPDGDLAVVAVPMSALTIKDTWHAAGMCGTGSNTVVAQDVFVPHHRWRRVSDLSHFGLALAGPLLGIVRAAIDHVDASLAKGAEIAYTSITDSALATTTQLARAQAQKAFDIASLLIARAASDLDSSIVEGGHPTEAERIRMRSDMATAVRQLQTAMHRLLDIAGAGAFASTNPLQRLWRDLEVASRNGFFVLDVIQEAHGRALLGVDEVDLSLR